jgi:hypothetical protein
VTLSLGVKTAVAPKWLVQFCKPYPLMNSLEGAKQKNHLIGGFYMVGPEGL